MGSTFYRDNQKLVCMGHPDCRRPCRYEPDEALLSAAISAAKKGVLTALDLRCILLDSKGFPAKIIAKRPGPDPTGRTAKNARYACERAYAKIGRRICELCSLLWAHDRPKGPRLTNHLELRYPKEEWKEVRSRQSGKCLKVKN